MYEIHAPYTRQASHSSPPSMAAACGNYAAHRGRCWHKRYPARSTTRATLTNATKGLAQRVKSEATQSLDITLSRGEFINIDGPGGIVIGTITDHAARQRLLASQPFRDCKFGCTGWMAYSQLGRTLPFDSSEQVSGHARALLSSAATPDSSCIIRFHYLGQTLPDKHSSPDLDIICLSQRTGALVYEFRAA